MSILIRGMEMPKGCAFCRLGKRNGKKMVCPLCDEEWDIHDPMSADHRLDNCPLVPVPPHGRLGDLDALVDWLKLSYGTSIPIVRGLLFSSIIKEIQEYPSVIPAEQKSKEEGEAK